jgi:hypothetical protein
MDMAMPNVSSTGNRQQEQDETLRVALLCVSICRDRSRCVVRSYDDKTSDFERSCRPHPQPLSRLRARGDRKGGRTLNGHHRRKGYLVSDSNTGSVTLVAAAQPVNSDLLYIRDFDAKLRGDSLRNHKRFAIYIERSRFRKMGAIGAVFNWKRRVTSNVVGTQPVPTTLR